LASAVACPLGDYYIGFQYVFGFISHLIFNFDDDLAQRVLSNYGPETTKPFQDALDRVIKLSDAIGWDLECCESDFKTKDMKKGLKKYMPPNDEASVMAVGLMSKVIRENYEGIARLFAAQFTKQFCSKPRKKASLEQAIADFLITGRPFFWKASEFLIIDKLHEKDEHGNYAWMNVANIFLRPAVAAKSPKH
jgi:hypothetical protein